MKLTIDLNSVFYGTELEWKPIGNRIEGCQSRKLNGPTSVPLSMVVVCSCHRLLKHRSVFFDAPSFDLLRPSILLLEFYLT